MRFIDIISDQEITEAPQRVAPTTFDLDQESENRAFVKKYLPKASEIIEQTSEYKIIRTGDGYNGWIFLYNLKNHSADYVVQYSKRSWKWMPETVTQCILWRDTYSPLVRNLTSRLFFDFLLPRFGAILSDRQQTNQGHEFWRVRMVDAIGRGLKVGIVDMSRHSIQWFEPVRDGNLRNWLTSQDTFGDAHRYQAIRYLISQ